MGRNFEDTGTGGGHVTGLISDYIDGTLAPASQEQVRAHIAVCQDCRTDYIELKAVQQMLHAVPMEAPPRSFTLTPAMVGAKPAERRSFLARWLTPAFAPRLATGSVLAFALLLLVLAIAPSATPHTALDAAASAFQTQPSFNPATSSGASDQAGTTASTDGATNKQAQPAPTYPSAMSAMSASAAPTVTTAAASAQAPMPVAAQATPTALDGTGASGGAAASSIINTPPPTPNLPPISASGNSSPTTITVGTPMIADAYPASAKPPPAGPSSQGSGLSTLAEAALGILGISLAAGAVLAWQKRS